MLARYYANAQGRFLSVDPSGRSVSLQHPQTWNRFVYALNNPASRVDPDGRVSYLVSRDIPLTGNTKKHMFVVTGARYLGDVGPNVKVHSFGKRPDGTLGAKSPQSDTAQMDNDAWASLATDSPIMDVDAVAIPAKDGKVRSYAEALIPSHDYSNESLGAEGTNSNTAAQAVANNAAGRDVEPPAPEDGLNGEQEEVPGTSRWREIQFDQQRIKADEESGRHSHHQRHERNQ